MIEICKETIVAHFNRICLFIFLLLVFNGRICSFTKRRVSKTNLGFPGLEECPKRTSGFPVCKKVVSTFSYSWKQQKALISAQDKLSLPLHKLITESPTRWVSHLQMIEIVLEQEKANLQVLAADKKTRHLAPS